MEPSQKPIQKRNRPGATWPCFHSPGHLPLTTPHSFSLSRAKVELGTELQVSSSFGTVSRTQKNMIAGQTICWVYALDFCDNRVEVRFSRDSFLFTVLNQLLVYDARSFYNNELLYHDIVILLSNLYYPNSSHKKLPPFLIIQLMEAVLYFY